MNKHIKLIISLGFLCLIAVSAHAQNSNGRIQGYYGNLAITDHLGVFIGAETSHGFIFRSGMRHLR